MQKLRGRSVLVQDGNIDKALRKFKKKIMETGLLNELREREFYTKPTTARKLKASAAKNRWKKKTGQPRIAKEALLDQFFSL